MGRGKIEIRRIENSSNRQVTYSKRRNGIIKKAKEISILCDSHVSVIIFSTSGKMHEFCSSSITLVDMLEQYHNLSGKRLWDAKHEHLDNEINRIKKENDNMQIELRFYCIGVFYILLLGIKCETANSSTQLFPFFIISSFHLFRHLRGDDITTLNYKELIVLEEALENGISTLKTKQTELVRMMRKHNEMIEEENRHLQFRLRQLHLDPMDGSNVMENQGQGIYDHQEIANFEACSHGQMPQPFAFRVQPMQPNLQDPF